MVVSPAVVPVAAAFPVDAAVASPVAVVAAVSPVDAVAVSPAAAAVAVSPAAAAAADLDDNQHERKAVISVTAFIFFRYIG